jgi:hypothetical protein
MTVVYVLRHHWVRKGGFELLSMALHCGTSAGIERLSERETCRLPSCDLLNPEFRADASADLS